MKYFAYGSNMSIRRLKYRTPGVELLGVFTLKQYDLRFHQHGSDGSGKCDAFFTGSDDDVVWGMVYEINREEKAYLDTIEGVGSAYEILDVQVENEAGEQLDVFMYVASAINPAIKPYSWYKIHVLTGALEGTFPQPYLEKINAVDVLVDDNKSRELQELAIYQPS
ncbi:hypothetical protein TDB9533_00239 [Thalassocella blandensis]|nr:hypothetical protein TDB9533_00239 [Thalassocella blandensis]